MSIEQLFFNKYSANIRESNSKFVSHHFPPGSQIEKMSDCTHIVNTYNIRDNNDDNKNNFDVSFEYELTNGKLVYNMCYPDADNQDVINDWQSLDEWMWMQLNDGWLADLEKAYPDKYDSDISGSFVSIDIDGAEWWITYDAALRLAKHANPRPNFEQQFLDKYERVIKSTTITKIPRKCNGITDIVYTYKLDDERTVTFKYIIDDQSDDDYIIRFGHVGKILLDDEVCYGWFELENRLNGMPSVGDIDWPLLTNLYQRRTYPK